MPRSTWNWNGAELPTYDSLYSSVRHSEDEQADGRMMLLVTMVLAMLLPLLVIAMYKKQQRAYWNRLGMPVMYDTPQGRSYPMIGQGITFLKYPPWDLLTTWHRQSNTSTARSDKKASSCSSSSSSSPIVCFPLLGTTMFSVASPSLCKAILQSKIAHVHKDVDVTMKPFLSILGTGIVTSEGAAWLKQRLKMSHPLRRDVLEIIPSHTLAAVQRLFQTLDVAAAEKGSVPLGSLLRHLTLQVISGSFLSLSAAESDSTFAVLYLPIVDESNKRVWHPYRRYCAFLPAFWEYERNVYQLNAYVSLLIRNRWELRLQERQTGVVDRPVDVLDRVLQVYEQEFPEQTILPQEVVKQFRDEMKTFMLAGHETSAAMMSWTMYELMLSSNKEETVQKRRSCLMRKTVSEANTVFDPSIDWKLAKENDIPAAEDLSKLVFAEASLKVRAHEKF